VTTYYEILKVAPTATGAEIEAAYEAQYNQWRRLVTHHDPSIVNQANQALQVLETIRATLTDPDKRSVYNAAIGLGGSMGGLADPEAILRMSAPVVTPPPPPRPAATSAPTGPTAGPGLWACPKCGTENPAQTKHCFKCGTQLVRECPECKQLSSLVATGFCGQCGYNYNVALRRAELRPKIAGLQEELAALSKNIKAVEAKKSSLPIWLGLIAAGAFCGGLIDTRSAGVWWFIAVTFLVFTSMASRSEASQKKTEIYNLTQVSDHKQAELNALEHEHKQLELGSGRVS